MSNSWVILVFCAYFAMLMGIAFVGARKMRNMSDYVLGGRRLSSFTAALSAGSSTTSAWTMLALPALAFVSGAVEVWVPAAAALGVWLSWAVLAKRLRRYTIEADNILTIPEFFAVRFGDKTGTLRTLTSIITVLFVLFYVSSGLVGGSKLLDTIFGIEAATGVLITLAAVASYTLIGGFLAVSRTDVSQALLMLLSLLILAGALFGSIDSRGSEISGTSAGFLNPFSDADGTPISPVFLLSAAGWAFGAFGAQRLLQRFMAVEREDRISLSRNMSVVWLIAVYGLALIVGMLARPALSNLGMLDQVADPERIYLVVSDVLFHPAVTGLLLTAVIAAVMSTADSQLLLASAVATDDLPLVRRISQQAVANARVWLGRLALLVIGGIAAAISILYPESIFDLVSYAWGGMGAAFGPTMVLALFWRRFNFWGAAASILSGTAVATVWCDMSGGPSGMWDIQPATPGFLVAMLVAVAVSLVTPKPPREVVDFYDKVNSVATP
ncbi:MAG: sodium/proline symporter [Chloroflexi bacterium]|nr:sodium/proline symporter [Chloroflexota bacterium]